MTRFCLTRLRGFSRDERGMLSVEAAIMAPMLIGFIMMMHTAFDIFRMSTTNTKASYTIGDLLSREVDPVDAAFISGMKDVFDYITLAEPDTTWLRVSVVRYDGDDEEFRLLWSQARGDVLAHTLATFAEVVDQIPEMAEEDTVVLVETYMPYPVSRLVGWRGFGYNNFVVTRPRFSSQLCWLSCNP